MSGINPDELALLGAPAWALRCCLDRRQDQVHSPEAEPVALRYCLDRRQDQVHSPVALRCCLDRRQDQDHSPEAEQVAPHSWRIRKHCSTPPRNRSLIRTVKVDLVLDYGTNDLEKFIRDVDIGLGDAQHSAPSGQKTTKNAFLDT